MEIDTTDDWNRKSVRKLVSGNRKFNGKWWSGSRNILSSVMNLMIGLVATET